MSSKKITSFLIIGSSIFVSIFLFRNSLKREIAIGETQEFSSQLVENFALKGGEEDQNLTKALLENLFNNIADKGLVKFNVLNVDLLENNPLQPFPEISEKELVITQDIFGKNQVEYFINLIHTSQKYIKEYDLYASPSKTIKNILEKGDVSAIKTQALGYKKISEDYYKIAVPKQWLDIHKAYISYFKTKQMAYEAIGNFNEDPLKAYFAATLLESLDKEGERIILLIDKMALENNLDFNEVFKSL